MPHEQQSEHENQEEKKKRDQEDNLSMKYAVTPGKKIRQCLPLDICRHDISNLFHPVTVPKTL